jgi:hypothetical protein
MFLYYRESGEIVAISPVEEKIEGTLVTKITTDIALSFIDGSKDSNQYRVVFMNGEIGFKKKDVIRRDSIRRSQYLFHSVSDDTDYDIEITTYIKKRYVKVSLHSKHLVPEQIETGTVYGYRYVPFHYVIDGDPHFLVSSVVVSFTDLLHGNPVHIDLVDEVSNCDIFIKNPFTILHRLEEN